MKYSWYMGILWQGVKTASSRLPEKRATSFDLSWKVLSSTIIHYKTSLCFQKHFMRQQTGVLADIQITHIEYSQESFV